MKKTLKYSGVTLLVIFGTLLFILLTRHVDRAGHFDAVMVDNELYFVPAEGYTVGTVTVFISSTTPPNTVVVWSARTLGDGNRQKTKQIKYGQKGFDSEEGPKELQKNVKYFAFMGTSLRASLGTKGDFIIIDDNKVIMIHHFDPKRPKNHTVIVERNGKKITVPYSVSFDKDGHKVIVSEPVPEK